MAGSVCSDTLERWFYPCLNPGSVAGTAPSCPHVEKETIRNWYKLTGFWSKLYIHFYFYKACSWVYNTNPLLQKNYKIHDGDSQLKLSIFLGFISRKVNQRPRCYKIPQSSGNIKNGPQWVDKQTLEVKLCGYKGIIQHWPSACVAMQPLFCERTCMYILNSQQQLSYTQSAGAYASFHVVRNARNCSLHM